MGLAVATYSLTLVVAAFPFLLSLGQAFFMHAQGKLTAAFMFGLGEWFFIGITLSIASVLVAIDTVFDGSSRRAVPLVSEFAIWSGICGLACLGCFTVYTLVKGHLAGNASLQDFTILGSLLVARLADRTHGPDEDRAMTPSQLMVVTIVASLLLMIRPSYLLFVAARGSFRRALYRMAIDEPDFSHIRQPKLIRLLLAISDGSPVQTPPGKPDVAKVIESCIEAYATNKVLIGGQIEAEVAKLNHSQRAMLAGNIDDLQGKLFQAATGVLRRRLSEALSGRGHRMLSLPFVQHMAVDGSTYYIEDFVNEIRHALSRLE